MRLAEIPVLLKVCASALLLNKGDPERETSLRCLLYARLAMRHWPTSRAHSYEPRAHHCVGAFGQRFDGDASAIPLRGARREGILRRNPRRESYEGHARPGEAYRYPEGGDV